jgi:hypothetical protein
LLSNFDRHAPNLIINRSIVNNLQKTIDIQEFFYSNEFHGLVTVLSQHQ